jgi:hypothetical protein
MRLGIILILGTTLAGFLLGFGIGMVITSTFLCG